MPVGAIIGGVASIAGGVLSSKAQKKAAGKAADTSMAVAKENNALQQKIYNQNYATLNPYAQRGNEAGNAINALLGIGGTGQVAGTPQAAPQPQAPAPAGERLQYLMQEVGPRRTGLINRRQGTDEQRLQYALSIAHPDERQFYNAQYGPNVVNNALGAVPSGTMSAAPLPTYQDAFKNYLGSTGYQFQVDQGNQAINQGYAAKGALQSGAALKALQTYGQNTATGFFKDYLGLLSNQQGVGLSGASAIAGVGQNYANNVGANNSAAGNAAANAALASGNATAGMWGNIAGGIGGIANAFGSSYKPFGS